MLKIRLLKLIGLISLSTLIQCKCMAGKSTAKYKDGKMKVWVLPILWGIEEFTIHAEDKKYKPGLIDLLDCKLVVTITEEKDHDGNAGTALAIGYDGADFVQSTRSLTLLLRDVLFEKKPIKELSFEIPVTLKLLNIDNVSSARFNYQLITQDGEEIAKTENAWKAVAVDILFGKEITVKKNPIELQIGIENLSPHAIDLKSLDFVCQIGNAPVLFTLNLEGSSIDLIKPEIMLASSDKFPLIVSRWSTVADFERLEGIAELPVTFTVKTKEGRVIASSVYTMSLEHT